MKKIDNDNLKFGYITKNKQDLASNRGVIALGSQKVGKTGRHPGASGWLEIVNK